jgi:Tfp pilus assembly protein PilF
VLSLPRALSSALLAAALAHAAPRTPASDAEVVEHLPAGPAAAEAARLRTLRAAAQAHPADPDAAAELARRHYALAAADGDPRHVGRAQAALARWWSDPAPPPRVRVMRAVLRQYGHDFAGAVADLDAVVQADPADAEAWGWLAAVHMVQADYAGARRACKAVAPHTSALMATACIAQVDAATGGAAAAASALRRALDAQPEAPAAERLWALTRLAETQERRGDAAAAEAAFREALGLGIADNYLRAAHADFLLDQGRPAEVLERLKDDAASDTLLLRLALAARQTGAPALADHDRALAARFDAARRRGDETHQKEESRWALGVRGDAQRALALAEANFALQREPADARVLLEAALAARRPDAATPALRWLADSGIESAGLQSLAARVRALQ